MATTAPMLATSTPFEIPPAPSPNLRFASLRHWFSRTEKTSEMAEARLLSRLAFFTMAGKTIGSPEVSKTVARVGQIDLDGDNARKINTLIIDQTGNDFVIENGSIGQEQEEELCKVLTGNTSTSPSKDTVDNELGFTNNVPQTDLQVKSHTTTINETPSLTRKNLVMCHGFGAGLGFWYRNYHSLSQVPGWRIYSIDWLGMGRSSRPKFIVKSNTLESVEEAENFFIDSLEKWREIHKLERMTLLGHSFGGYLAAVYALKYPNRVERLILVSPVGIPVNPHENSNELKTPSGRTLPGWVVRLWNANITPQTILRWTGPFGPSLVSNYTSRRFAYLEERDRIDLHDYIYQISSAPGSGEYALAKILAPGAYARKPLMHRLGGLEIPTTFLYGEHDWMDYRAAEEACRTMSVPTKIVQIPRAGHHLYLDNPPEFDRAVVKEMLEQQQLDSP